MKTAIPSEFVGFIRETGVRAFDRLSLRARELDTPHKSLARTWARMDDDQKRDFFDLLIDAARDPGASEEAPRPQPRQRAVKRYDPEEVAATLPRKPAVRKSQKKTGARKSRKKAD